MASIFPESIICAINRPLDDKTNKLDLTERNALPTSQRYKGMFVVVQNALGTQSQVYWLPTDNLTNSGWVEFEAGAAAVSDGVIVRDWAAAAPYVLNQLIAHEGVLYRCKATHTSSAAFAMDTANWAVLGGAAKVNAYTHVQAMPAAVWLIQHNFNESNRAFSIMAKDTSGEQIVGQVDLAACTNNLLAYRFGEPLAGEADIKL